MNLNKVQLIGRVTRDPELRNLPSGAQVAKFGLATNHSYKNKNSGEKVETTQFHNCVAFAGLAGVIGQYVKKGQEIYVGGRIEYRAWEGKDGSKKTSTEIMVDDMQMGARAGSGQQSAPRALTPAEMVEKSGVGEAYGSEGTVADVPPAGAMDEDINVEDIPF